jgi:hypothetical protein
MQGDVTDKVEIARFMNCLMRNGGYADMTIRNYTKDGMVILCNIRCLPLVDSFGKSAREEELKVSHIGVIVTSHEAVTVEALLKSLELEEDTSELEVGLPLDRRENCNVYSKCGDFPPLSIPFWRQMAPHLATSLMLRYTLRSQAPLVLIDRYS